MNPLQKDVIILKFVITILQVYSSVQKNYSNQHRNNNIMNMTTYNPEEKIWVFKKKIPKDGRITT